LKGTSGDLLGGEALAPVGGLAFRSTRPSHWNLPRRPERDAANRKCAGASANNIRDARLTPVRRRVLELILRADQPTGAYALLAELQRGRGKLGPPTIYRALDFCSLTS
jgi:hypothetical protein